MLFLFVISVLFQMFLKLSFQKVVSCHVDFLSFKCQLSKKYPICKFEWYSFFLFFYIYIIVDFFYLNVNLKKYIIYIMFDMYYFIFIILKIFILFKMPSNKVNCNKNKTLTYYSKRKRGRTYNSVIPQPHK
jgi:hypothetical protein